MKLGQYEILERIAVGGMAEIFLAQQTGENGFRRRLIIKRILPGLAAEPEFVASFLNEARLCASLNHPNIVQVFELGRIGSQHFIAMELVVGRDLSSCLKEDRRSGNRNGRRRHRLGWRRSDRRHRCRSSLRSRRHRRRFGSR